ncbi:MAG: hypothetical protein HY973_01325 [Candidatus Kerfeldbacteria bacterium]|nr:hypothetical protein [Candidatus Kerfeldbacteria bacterium]
MAPDNQTGHRDSWQLGLGLVAVLALALGFWQLRNSIRMPFAPPANTNEQTTTPTNSEDVESLKNKDSDGDGLSDYDEIYLYHTSSYLKDTDSDGVDDKTETTRGTDPNCPEGKTCEGVNFQAPASSVNEKSANTSDQPQPTAAAIRDYLKKNGATDDFLAKYSDQELLNMYQQVSGEVTPAPAGPAPSNTTSKVNLKPEDKAALQKMTAVELRQFLIKGGADKATLDKIDDATLKAMVEQIINGQ